MRRAVVLVLLGIAVPAAAAAFWVGSEGRASAAGSAAQPAKIVFLDVGQGDGVAMRIGSTVVLSDAGEFNVTTVEETLRSLGRTRNVDIAVLSHPHDDHVRNFIELLSRGWRFGRVLLSDSAHWNGTATNRALIRSLREQAVPLQFVNTGDTFTWGGAQVTVLNPPPRRFTGGANQAANVSIVYLLTVNGITALFTGDIEPKVAREVAAVLEPNLNRPVDIFLATHHGSKHGSVAELLDVVRPRWAVLSTAAGNSFGHPAPEAVARLKAAGSTIWCTDTNGSVTARISAAGSLTWRASRQVAPFWSGKESVQNGTCGG